MDRATLEAEHALNPLPMEIAHRTSLRWSRVKPMPMWLPHRTASRGTSYPSTVTSTPCQWGLFIGRRLAVDVFGGDSPQHVIGHHDSTGCIRTMPMWLRHRTALLASLGPVRGRFNPLPMGTPHRTSSRHFSLLQPPADPTPANGVKSLDLLELSVKHHADGELSSDVNCRQRGDIIHGCHLQPHADGDTSSDEGLMPP